MDNDDLEIINAAADEAEVELPPVGELRRRPPENGAEVLIMRTNLLQSCLKGHVIEVKEEENQLFFSVKIDNKNKIKTVSAKDIAVANPSTVIVPEGIRVIARYTDPSGVSDYYVGVVMEPPKTKNRKRYLIGFDDGSVQYVYHNDVFVVCKQSVDVADDIHDKCLSNFFRRYLESYPEYPMSKFSVGQHVSVECNFEWIDAKVVELDCSLVKIEFERNSEETEWIYRGSGRFKSEQNSSIEIPNQITSVSSSETYTESSTDVPACSEVTILESVPSPSAKDESDDEPMDFDSIDINFDE